MAEEMQYRGYNIRTTSYQTDQGKWVPQADITPIDETENWEEGPLTWEQTFDTQLEADDYALQSAQFYIDNHD